MLKKKYILYHKKHSEPFLFPENIKIISKGRIEGNWPKFYPFKSCKHTN